MIKMGDKPFDKNSRRPPNSRNPQPKSGSRSVYPVGWREPIPSGELTATRRPSRPDEIGLSQAISRGRLQEAKSLPRLLAQPIQRGIREQEQLTFNFEDSSPEASRHNTAGGESGRTRTVSGNYWSGSTNANNTTNAWNKR